MIKPIPKVGIVDYGSGNITALQQALKCISIESLLKYVDVFILDKFNKNNTTNVCTITAKFFSRLKKAIDNTIINVVAILISGLILLRTELL